MNSTTKLMECQDDNCDFKSDFEGDFGNINGKLLCYNCASKPNPNDQDGFSFEERKEYEHTTEINEPTEYNQGTNTIWLYNRLVAFSEFLSQKPIQSFDGKIIAAINSYLVNTPTIKEPTIEFFDGLYTKIAEDKALANVF